MSVRRATRSALALVALLAAAPLSAQDTGGSFGGSDFGGSDAPSSDSSGGSDYGGSDYGGPDYGGSSGAGDGGSSEGGGRVLFFLTLLALGGGLLFLIVESVQEARGKKGGPAQGRPAPPRPIDVSAVQLALDWNARVELQRRLDSLAREGDTTSSGGRAALLHETVAALLRHSMSWLYAGAVNAEPSEPSTAEATFRRVASEARSRFRIETVRQVDGHRLEQPAGEPRPRAEEGPGVVVVTVVVAARKTIPDIRKATDATELRSLLRELGAIHPNELVGLEVIWSPADDDDRMSTAELERLYPELRRIEEATLLGRVFCGYCGSPFANELPRCPHCGAPGSDARRRKG